MHTNVQLARNADLAEWLHLNGVPLKRVGQWWHPKDTDSLRIQGNKWFHNSKGTGGNAIDYLMMYHGFSFQEANHQLLNTVVKEKNLKDIAFTKVFDCANINLHCDQRRTLAYLIKTRGIEPKLVVSQIQDGNLFEESLTGNVLFPMKDKFGNTVGFEVAGTFNFNGARFKGVKSGSDLNYGFAIGERDSPKYILFFESAVDLLSFITISQKKAKSLKSCLLVSMAGLRHSVIKNTLHLFGQGNTVPVLCSDNDAAGSYFNTRIRSIYAHAIVKSPLQNFKDWNEQLLNLYPVNS